MVDVIWGCSRIWLRRRVETSQHEAFHLRLRTRLYSMRNFVPEWIKFLKCTSQQLLSLKIGKITFHFCHVYLSNMFTFIPFDFFLNNVKLELGTLHQQSACCTHLSPWVLIPAPMWKAGWAACVADLGLQGRQQVERWSTVVSQPSQSLRQRKRLP